MSDNKIRTAEFSLDALKAGDPEETRRFVEDNSNAVYRLALRMLGDEQDAEDVLQETFVKALRSLKSFEGRSSLSTWLFRIATNEALMLLRKKKPDAVSIDAEREDDEGQLEPVQLVDWCCMPERELLSDESKRHMEAAIQKLSPALRAVFELRDIEGLSVRETADVLNVSEAVVKTRLLRARLKLREELSAYFGSRLLERRSHGKE
ncbi:MAG TPA: sigma-70 family RNA polymerase sigma factor [Longilinea sp.]|nr:sigma-70 family RNA polymerase sigma factor [Longilinea sp.]